MISEKAEDLRRAFDRSFAELPHEERVQVEDLLAIRVGGDPFALRLHDVSGLFADKVVTALPSNVSELVGVAGFRGSIIPVYDLRALLGYAVSEPSRWMLVVAAKVALAFDRFEGHLRVPRESIAVQPPSERARHVTEVVRGGGVARPIVHVPSVLEAIGARARRGNVEKER
jgi:chemotaxis signal transduction protein